MKRPECSNCGAKDWMPKGCPDVRCKVPGARKREFNDARGRFMRPESWCPMWRPSDA